LVLAAACANRPPLPDGAAQPAVAVQEAIAGSPDAAVETITPGDMRARIGFLASDALRGRDTPSPGLEVAAAYIASEFMRMGLEPAGDDRSYLQRYPFILRTAEPQRAALRFRHAGGDVSLVPGTDFYSLPGGPAATGAPVFVGADLDSASAGALAGRVVLAYVDNAGAGPAAGAANRLRGAAQRAGARALIVVLHPDVTAEQIGERARPGRPGRVVGAPLPVAFVRYDRAAELLRAAGLDPDALRRQAVAGGMAPIAANGVSIDLDTPFTDADHRPPNVVAVLPGSDPTLRDTYVVLSAHMDHVGVGNPDASGDSIFNGADDDASGTSAVLEVAEAFASMSPRPGRSIVFLTVSGEEKGLLGSAYYADHPTVPADRIVANINIDMIGRNAPDTVVAIGQEFSSLGPLTAELTRRHPDLGLTAAPDLWPEQRFFFRSDHFSFAAKEIPAIFFFAGVHEDYHRPSDEVEKIDEDKAARISRLVFWLTHAIATNPEPPAWTTEGLAQVRALVNR
jgi:hypothetical protein